jgi:ribonuclease BN (tRNA processing enzyme)
VILDFLGTHNSESDHTRLVSVLIDGVLAVDAGSLTAGLTFSEQSKINSILLSHGHFDHIRDTPTFAFNNLHRTTRIFATAETLNMLSSHLIDGEIYPAFWRRTEFVNKPALELMPVEPNAHYEIDGYRVYPVAVNHSVHAVGFEIIKDGQGAFYTGDTGPGLSPVWEVISPQILIIDLTFPDSQEKTARDSRHLCPKLFKKEMLEFRRIKGYLPQIIPIHMHPKFEDEIRRDMEHVNTELGVRVHFVDEGERVVI